MHTLILGAGYSGLRIAQLAAECGSVCGTRRERVGIDELAAAGVPGCLLNENLTPEFTEQLARATHLVVSVAPGREPPLNDPMLSLLSELQNDAFKSLEWIGYLSTIGVYGHHEGHWVDEQTPCLSTQSRSIMRREAEIAWSALGESLNVPVSILRLSGIYGPGRNAIEDALAGKARMLIKKDQVFNRIHVDDLAAAVMRAAQLRHGGILNITDDVPAAPQEVVRFAHSLAGLEPPDAIDFESAQISPMARSFYSENKRVRNQAGKDQLGLQYRFPNYRVALSEIWNNRNGK